MNIYNLNKYPFSNRNGSYGGLTDKDSDNSKDEGPELGDD